MNAINRAIEVVKNSNFYGLSNELPNHNGRKRKRKPGKCYGCMYGPHELQAVKPRIEKSMSEIDGKIVVRSNRMDDFSPLLCSIEEDGCQSLISVTCQYYYSKYHKIPVDCAHLSIIDVTINAFVVNLPEFEWQRRIPLDLQDGHEEYVITRYTNEEVNKYCKREYGCDLQQYGIDHKEDNYHMTDNICLSPWVPWVERGKLEHLEYPGIYIIGKYDKNIKNDLDYSVLYIGKTEKNKNESEKLKKRLNDFHKSAFMNKYGHSGGNSFKFRVLPQSVWDTFPEYPVPEWLWCRVVAFKDLHNMADTIKMISSLEKNLIGTYKKKNDVLPCCNSV